MKRLFLLISILVNTSVFSQNKPDVPTILDSAVVISLERHAYRYDITKDLMEKAGFTNIKRFKAVDGYHTHKKFFKKLHIKKGSLPEKGCAASHLLVWKEFVDQDSDKEYLFVCEDDMVPHSYFSEIFPHYWEATPKNFDIVMVGNHLSNTNNTDIIVKSPALNMHAYIISKKGAKKLLELYPKHRGVIDHFTVYLMEKNLISYYCYNGKQFPDPEYPYGGSYTGICFQNTMLPTTITERQ